MTDEEKKEKEKQEREAAGAKVLETLTAIREEIGENNVDLTARLDVLEQSRESETTDLVAMREELDAIKTQAAEREATIREIERRNVIQLEADPAHKREHALSLFGMQMRREIARGQNLVLPERFDAERETLETYERERHERATLDIQTTQGGYFIPTVLVMEIHDTLEEVSDLLGAVDLQTGVPTKGSGVTLTGRPTLQPKRASSDTDPTQSDPAFGQWEWDADEGYIYFPVDNWMLELSPISLGERLLGIARDAFIQGLVDWLINADGSAAYNSNTGVLNDTTKVVRMAGNSFGDLTNADLRKLMRGVLKRARSRGQFLTGPYAIDVLEDVDRQGKVPVLRETADGSYIVKGKALLEDEGMPDETASAVDAAFLAFGDPKTWGVVLAGSGLRVAADASHLFARNQTGFRATGMIDLVRKPGNTWALLKTKAS